MRAILFLLLLSISNVLSAEEAKQYIGLVYPPMPSGLVDKGGGLAKGNASDNGLWYGYVEFKSRNMVWLTREIGRVIDEGRDRALWRVEDTLLMPALRKGESIHQGNDIECTFKGKPDTSIIAIGKWKLRKNGVFGYADHIRLAWRIHPLLEKFEAISPSEVTCELNEDRD